MTHVIIVTGIPASGKSALANELKRVTNFPIISKDKIKENLYDSLGCGSREESRKLGLAAMNILWSQANDFVVANISCILEANFKPEFNNAKDFKNINSSIIQVMCKADPEVVFNRFSERAKADRHPGHFDLQSLDEFKKVIFNGLKPLEYSDYFFEIDTTVINDELVSGWAKNIITSSGIEISK